MPAQSEKRIFTYQTRVTLTPDQHRALADYAALFCRVERTLHADLQSGKPAELLNSEYLLRFGITFRQFNAAKIQLQGKIKAIRELLPIQIEDLKTKIKKAKKTIAKLVKRVPGSEIVHLKKRRLAGLECRLKQREADRKSGRVRLCFGSRKLFHAQFDLQANGLRSHEEWLARCWQGGERSVPTSSLYWAPRMKREGCKVRASTRICVSNTSFKMVGRRVMTCEKNPASSVSGWHRRIRARRPAEPVGRSAWWWRFGNDP